jgi:hypothetical protein
MPGKPPSSLTWAALAALVFLALAAGDLGLRSRSALLEAQKYETWRDNPAQKAAYFEAGLKEELRALELKSARTAASPEAAARAAALLTAEKDFRLEESSAKLAYVWYKTAASEFRSPLNPWAARARARLPGALAAWKAELAAKNIKAGDWMTE